ncbi:MAG: hypothetical protein NTU58_01690 [Candidatus Nealsonbacteria bacterium]|nr:hypothetical protein [Candidatus Nealsonbacteria bacterium]
MEKRIRNILIVIFGVIFVLAIPLVILYCQGYRFDFETKKIIKTGGFAFKAQPKNCEIYINDKLTKKTDFIFGEVFIKNLLPKKYNIKIKKNGFSDWEKNLEVKEKMVTEAKNVLLFPKENNFSAFLPGIDIENYYFSPDENKIILKKNTENTWELSVFNLESKEEKLLLKEVEYFKQKGVAVLDLKWSSDSKKILLETQIKKEVKYFVIDVLKENEEYIFSLDYSGKPKEILFNNQNSQELFFLKTTSTGTNLFKTNFYQKSLSKLPIENVISYQLSNGNIFWLDKDGFLSKSDLSGNNSEILNKESFPVEQGLEVEIKILPNQKIFLNNKNGLYLFNPETKIFEKILNSIKDLKFSPDSKNIYFSNNYEIWLSDQSLKEFLFLNRFSKKIDDIFWLNSDYLIFNTEEKIKISEVDPRDRINIVEIGNFENPKIFWSQNHKTLYLLSKGSLYSLGNLVP